MPSCLNSKLNYTSVTKFLPMRLLIQVSPERSEHILPLLFVPTAAAAAASLKPVQLDDQRLRASVHRRLGPAGGQGHSGLRGHQAGPAGNQAGPAGNQAGAELGETRLISVSKRLQTSTSAEEYVPKKVKVEKLDETEEASNDEFSDLGEIMVVNNCTVGTIVGCRHFRNKKKLSAGFSALYELFLCWLN